MSDWTTVTTANAPSWMIVLHSQYHRGLGARTPVYFLDAPQKYLPEERALLSECARIVPCDDAYWNAIGGRPPRPVLRQLVNLRVARKMLDMQWILHIDIDEFLYIYDWGHIEGVFDLPREISEIRIQNAERVLAFGKKAWTDGYLRVRTQKSQLLEKHYGLSSGFFGLGMSNYFHGKSFVRNRPKIKQGIHGAIHEDASREIIRYELNRQDAVIVHYPCITPGHFASRYLPFLRGAKQDAAEFHHQQLFRTTLAREAQRLGVRDAIIKYLKELHYCSSQQALGRLEDGLYVQMPEQFLARLSESALDSRNISLAWANKSISQYYGLLASP